jgi:hypothetical protein
MIGFIGTSVTITRNYNRLQQLTIDDCLRLAPFLTGLRLSSTVTDLVLIYESVISSASVVGWLTLHSWTFSSLPNDFQWTLLYNSRRTEERLPPRTIRLLLFVSSLLRNVCQSRGNAFISTSVFVATQRAFSEPLSSNGLFRHNILVGKLKGADRLGDAGAYMRIILERVLKRSGVWVCGLQSFSPG